MMQSLANWPQGIFILIPSYQSASSISKLLPELTAFIPKQNICIVDDGSADSTDIVCQEHAVTCISLPVNKGKGAALEAGFSYLIKEKAATWIITMDADGQHALADIPLFLSTIKSTYRCGIIIGKRKMTLGTMPFPRIISNRLTSGILSIFTKCNIIDSQCGYRAYNALLLAKTSCKYSRFEMESEIILRSCKLGFSISFIPVQTLYLSSQSHISLFTDTLRWIRAVVLVWLELRKN